MANYKRKKPREYYHSCTLSKKCEEIEVITGNEVGKLPHRDAKRFGTDWRYRNVVEISY